MQQEKTAGKGHVFLSPAEKSGSLNLPEKTSIYNFSNRNCQTWNSGGFKCIKMSRRPLDEHPMYLLERAVLSHL